PTSASGSGLCATSSSRPTSITGTTRRTTRASTATTPRTLPSSTTPSARRTGPTGPGRIGTASSATTCRTASRSNWRFHSTGREGETTPRRAVVTSFDVAIIGAGAAGLHCAAIAGQLGLRVVMIDHAERVAEKIRISGGGRCNFTNIDTSPAQFLSRNPDFCRSALARYSPRDFVDLVERHGIAWHDKHKGQLFCDDSSQQIIDMLLAECAVGGVAHWQPSTVESVAVEAGAFALSTTRGAVVATKLVVATGGLSIPKIGASDFGYRLARRFGHSIVETKPGLVPLLLPGEPRDRFEALAGVSLPVRVATGSGHGQTEFLEDLLFTHRGLSGPAALQISSYWRAEEGIVVDLAPGIDLRTGLLAAKR